MLLRVVTILSLAVLGCAMPESEQHSGSSNKSEDARLKQGTEIGNGNKADPKSEQNEQTNAPGGAANDASNFGESGRCDGTRYGGFCVHLGAEGKSCSETCGGRSRVDRLTHLMFGTENSANQCGLVLDALKNRNFEVQVVQASAAFPATGCSLIGNDAYIFYGQNETDPDAKRENLQRVCICK